ncbi:hypothetical protein CVV38_00610 [Candidatus Peregrinibacteria bacterium HGW-Peregrinibacteria-1]|jgi:thiamine biosynthesis lipoprotein|nr:MAG: hypothetical protein CVV38_00610 [Candidatus Peregrinibacteria bacterium HGW-Peregrinibacteria-1]
MKFFRDNILGTRAVLSFGAGAEKYAPLVEDLFEEISRVERAYSRFREDSCLADLNRRGKEWCEVDDEMWGLLVFADNLSKESGGVFNIGVEEILSSWGYDKNYSFSEGGEVGDVLAPDLDFENRRVRVNSRIDFGGLGKGYALDCGVRVLKRVPNFLLDLGGDIYARGEGLDGNGWKVALENPFNVEEGLGVVVVDDFFVAASNGERRSWRDRHHLVDVKKKAPAGDMASVFVQGGSGIAVDAWATTLYCMGYEKACEYLKNAEIVAMVVAKNGRTFRSADFKGDIF